MPAENEAMGADGGDDLYSDGMDAADTPAAKDDGEEMDKGKDDGRDSEEAILPRSICAGMDVKVGDRLSFEVTALHDKELSVKYAPDSDKEDDKGGDKAAVPAGMGGGQDSMYD